MSASEEAVAAGLADNLDDNEPVQVREVATDADVNDDGVRVDAEIVQLPVRQEPSGELTPGMALVPVRDELKGLTELAVTLAIADNTPAALKGKPAAVLAVFLTGRELGIPPMTALRNLHVIDGTVTVNPKVRSAMVHRQGLGRIFPHQGPRDILCPRLDNDGHDDRCPLCEGRGKVTKLCDCGAPHPDNDEDSATWHAKRADDPHIIYSSTYTMAMADQVQIKSDGSKLSGKSNWKNYPTRMLSWRALGYLLDDAFPEVGTGLYSPDEIGAITDEEGEPIIDVESTEVLTDKAKADRKERNAKPEPTAPPDTIAAFKERIEVIKGYEGAPNTLLDYWNGWRGEGKDRAEPLPPLDELLYKQCRVASSLIDMVEKRIAKGEFKQVESVADVVDGDGGDDTNPDPDPEAEQDTAGDTADAPQDPPGAPTSADEAPAAADLPFDPQALPQGRTPGDDLSWVEASPEGMLEEVAEQVRELPADQLIATMKTLDLSPNGLNEATKRSRITARRIRVRMERMAGLS